MGRIASVVVALVSCIGCNSETQGVATGGVPLAPGGAVAPYGAPVTVQADRTWTWVNVPETRCMDGSPTGFGVNIAAGSKRVAIVLEPGGACFDDATCTVGAVHPNGFNESAFESEMSVLGGLGILDRNNRDNPFADWSYVFVPYCSGDIHAGNNPSGWHGRMHMGYVNLGYDLARIVPTFADATQVVLTGSSAGGFGAAYNFDRVQQAFGKTRVDVLDDSGPVLPDAYLKPCLQKKLRAMWNLDSTLPQDCAACLAGDGGLINLPVFLAEKYPDRRGGIISSTYDEVIRTFFSSGYSADCSSAAYFPPGDYWSGLDGLQKSLAGHDNFHVYYIWSVKHTWLIDEPLGALVNVSGVGLNDWLRGFVDGESTWGDVTP